MLVDFNELPEHSRIWIYQSNRSFTDAEQEEIKEELDSFLKEWTAHGSHLHAGFEIKYKRFIVIGLDQTNASASGCSIDASVHFVQSLEKKYNVELLDRMNVSFKQGEFIAYKPLKDFKKMAKDKSVSPNTIVFNNLVATKQEYLEHWEVPASESWHSRFV
ncbi:MULTISPECIES: ABC transporter ATPase [Flagellimonas]|uniref:ABC transporter ATPase n=1 Tax=Flagellimonas hadalis TaxID=2597517 RepID=A0A5N5IUP7_9FLAO|nr:ABC transporter ATPase [Allomuricauda hadalis]KAB5491495.1 ABC transporter ATPase [Allomuricauda hadalis]RUA12051.1 MAG: ABC transporter ATPase [Flavobacteriia bacterium]